MPLRLGRDEAAAKPSIFNALQASENSHFKPNPLNGRGMGAPGALPLAEAAELRPGGGGESTGSADSCRRASERAAPPRRTRAAVSFGKRPCAPQCEATDRPRWRTPWDP